MRKLALVLVLLSCATGCAGIIIPTAKTQLLTPETVELFKPYSNNAVMEKSVGDQLVGYNLLLKAKAYPGFVATEDFQPQSFAYGQDLYPIKKDSEWVAIAKLETGGYLCRNKKEAYQPKIMSFGQEIKAGWDACLLVNSDNEPYGTAVCSVVNPIISVWKQKPATNFLKPKKIIERDDQAWREARIIYAGKTKDAVRFIYQETALRDLEFTFDLSESNVVAVKDIMFEILDASNVSIKYKILTKPEDLKQRIEKRDEESALSQPSI